MVNHQFSFEAIGTQWIIDFKSSPSSDFARLRTLIEELVERFDVTYSRFRTDSLVAQLNQKPGTYIFPDNAKTLLDLYWDLYELSEAKFTPLIGNVLVQAGYDAAYSLNPQTLHTPPLWEKVLDYNHPQLTVQQPVTLDFGAAGKGYLIDLIADLLTANQIETYTIDGSGDIKYQHTANKALQVGLEHPHNSQQIIGVAELVSGSSIASSAGNRRRWNQYHHIINPQTLNSPTNILATWVIADTAIKADALATALFLATPDQLLSRFDFEYLILYPDMQVNQSSTFPSELFRK